ncbi:MAG: SBBP repeat-containing protein [Waterburya sp.]
MEDSNSLAQNNFITSNLDISASTASLWEMAQSFLLLDVYGLLVGTPGSDSYLVGRPEKDDTLLTRQGKDLLLAVDPASENPGLGEVDTLVGDRDIFDVFSVDGILPVEENLRLWQDTFIVGDRQQPYYIGEGDDDYASILDFDPELDILQLHGTAANYQLKEISGNTLIYWQQDTEADLVASLSEVSGLSLDQDYFQFTDDLPVAEPTTPQIEQLGTSGVDLSVGIAGDDADGIFLTGASGDSFWIAKYDNNGNQQWVEPSPSTGSLGSDGLGNVYVGGGLGDINLTKYNSQGEQQWTQSLGTFSLDNSFNLDVDNEGNVYLVGYTLDDLGGENAGELMNGSMPIVSTDSWIAKYDSNGNQQWLQQFGSGDFDEAFAIATDRDSNVYTSGWTLGDLGGENTGLYDIWVAKNDTDGNQQWVDQFGTPDYDWSWDAAVDSEDNLYLTGWTLGDLGGENAGSYDGWVAKYDSEGNQQWIQQFGTAGDDTARSIDFDELGNFYVTGSTDADFGDKNAGSYDTWVAKYDSNGNQQWVQQFGTAATDNPFDLSVDNNGQILVTGFTEGSLGATNAGAHDAWLAVLSSTGGDLISFSNDSTASNLLPDSSSSLNDLG